MGKARARRSRCGAAIAGALTIALAAAGCSAPARSGSSSPVPTLTASVPTATATRAPVVANDVAQGDQGSPIDVAVAGPVQVTMREITIRPGNGTGRHCHHGTLIAVVKHGVLTHYAPVHPGGVEAYRAGQSVVEGPGYVHEGKNEGTEDVVLWVTYLTPEGKPLAETDLAKCAG